MISTVKQHKGSQCSSPDHEMKLSWRIIEKIQACKSMNKKHLALVGEKSNRDEYERAHDSNPESSSFFFGIF